MNAHRKSHDKHVKWKPSISEADVSAIDSYSRDTGYQDNWCIEGLLLIGVSSNITCEHYSVLVQNKDIAYNYLTVFLYIRIHVYFCYNVHVPIV